MKLVVIKKYSSAPEAYIDATLLESCGIKCVVDGDSTESVLPYLQNGVTLSVMEDMEQKAIETLNSKK